MYLSYFWIYSSLKMPYPLFKFHVICLYWNIPIFTQIECAADPIKIVSRIQIFQEFLWIIFYLLSIYSQKFRDGSFLFLDKQRFKDAIPPFKKHFTWNIPMFPQIECAADSIKIVSRIQIFQEFLWIVFDLLSISNQKFRDGSFLFLDIQRSKDAIPHI